MKPASFLPPKSLAPLEDVLSNSNSFVSSPTSYSPLNMALSKEGWLEKYSVGRGALPMKNWRKRHFVANVSGLDYFDNPPRNQTNNLKGKPFDVDGSRKSKSKTEKRKIYFSVANSQALSHTGSQRQLPVFLLPHIDESFHPAAVNAGPANPFQNPETLTANNNIYYYFALRFSENKQTLLLLCRTRDPYIRREWTDFLGLFIHSLGSNPAAGGMLSSHPILVQEAAAENFEQQRAAYKKAEEQKGQSAEKKRPSRFDGYKKNRKELEMSHINGNNLDSNLNDNQQIVLKWDEGLNMRFVEHNNGGGGGGNNHQSPSSPISNFTPSNAPSNSSNSSNIALGGSSTGGNAQWNNFFGPSAIFNDDNTNSIAPPLTRQVSSALGDAVYWTDDDHGSEFDDI